MRSMRTRPPPPPCHTLTHTRSLLQAHSHFFHKKTPLPHKVLTCCLSLSRTRSLPPTPSLSRAYSLSLWQENSSPFHTFTTCYRSSCRAMSLLSLLLRLPLSRSYLRMSIHSCMCVHICRVRELVIILPLLSTPYVDTSSYEDTFLHVRTHLYTSVEFVICRVRDSRSVYLCFQHHHSRGRIWIHIYMCIFRFQLCEWRRAYSRCL